MDNILELTREDKSPCVVCNVNRSAKLSWSEVIVEAFFASIESPLKTSDVVKIKRGRPKIAVRVAFLRGHQIIVSLVLSLRAVGCRTMEFVQDIRIVSLSGLCEECNDDLVRFIQVEMVRDFFAFLRGLGELLSGVRCCICLGVDFFLGIVTTGTG